MKINWKVLIFSLVIVYAVAFIGSMFTSQNTQTQWYQNIKPALTPPNFVFPIVWNILFFLIALSLYFAWTKAKNMKMKRIVATVFAINLFLNMLWSFLFFAIQSPAAAFVEIIALWASIVVMMAFTYKISKISMWLLLPYLLWVSFATVLNFLAAF